MFRTVRKQLQGALDSIYSEFDEHLSAINANTNEIQTNFEHLSELDQKMDKLQERMDDIYMILENICKNQQILPKSETYTVENLSNKEKEVFRHLYSTQCTTVKDLAHRTGYSEELVQHYICQLMAKGVPIRRESHAGIRLEQSFIEEQAKFDIAQLHRSEA